MTPRSCNGQPPGPLQWPFRFATVHPRTVAMAPPSCNGPPLGLLQWSLRVAAVHPLDCCNGFSELQRSTPWIVDRILFGSGRRDDGAVMFCVCLARFLLNIKTALVRTFLSFGGRVRVSYDMTFTFKNRCPTQVSPVNTYIGSAFDMSLWTFIASTKLSNNCLCSFSSLACRSNRFLMCPDWLRKNLSSLFVAAAASAQRLS